MQIITELFDMVMTDMSMPGLDGNELVRFLKASASNIPVVAITGKEEKASKLFNRVLGKPNYTKDLIKTIQEIFSEKSDRQIN